MAQASTISGPIQVQGDATSGTLLYELTVRNSSGTIVDADATPTWLLRLGSDDSTITGNVVAQTNPSTGNYTISYSYTSSSPTRPDYWKVRATFDVAAAAQQIDMQTQFLEADQTLDLLNTINGKLGDGGTARISPIIVAKSRTWYPGTEGFRARNIVAVKQNFAGTLAFAIALNDDADIDINGAHTVTVTGAATVTTSNLSTSADGQYLHFDVPALTLKGSYTVTVTAKTVDGQTIPMTGTLRVN